jgi:hypothetical protein
MVCAMPQEEPCEQERDELRRALLDDQYDAPRRRYASTMVDILVSVDGWLAIDSWLGGGKVGDFEAHEFGESFHVFRAVSMVVSMSTELAEAASVMGERRRYYAVGAVIRQLIECEYLLTLFSEDLDRAREWIQSSPDDIRAAFNPAKMRKITGKFSNEEYWGHCDTGGHPAPKGARLLENFSPDHRVWRYSAAGQSIDLGLHLHRIWRAIDESWPNTTLGTRECGRISGNELRMHGACGARRTHW